MTPGIPGAQKRRSSGSLQASAWSVLLASLLLGGCDPRFLVQVTVELGTLPVPADLEVTVMELDSGNAVLSTTFETVNGPAFWAQAGETNRVLVTRIAGDTASVRVEANALDDMGTGFASGVADVDREPRLVEATLLLEGNFCGDGVRGDQELCDGMDLGGADCLSLGIGFDGGTLACAPDCAALDTSACTIPPGCDNGELDPMEACDGSLLGGATCVSEGFDGGTIVCSPACQLDTSGCHLCGDGTAAGPEECDGPDLNMADCSSLGLGFDSGILSCSGACTFDVAGCGTCGNAAIDGGEACDGMDLGLQTCTTVGMFDEGVLGCAADCSFDTSSCIACGDGVAEGTEICDGSDLLGADCVSIGQGWIGGVLGCDSTCGYDTSGCMPPPNCPNGMIDPGEDCEGSDLNGGTCSSASAGALVNGTLACTGGCAFDTSGCYSCGDGAITGAEVCDAGDLAGETCVSVMYDGGTLGCAADCLSFDESNCTTCGDGMAEGTELCDGADLNGNGCVDVGMFSGGTLACNNSCNGWNSSGCNGPPTIPVLRKPMNNSYVGSVNAAVGSLRPAFAWDASTVAGGALVSYDIEYSTDPSFGTLVTANSVPFTSFQPGADLPVAVTPPVGGRYFWRVRACAGNACSAWSTVWWVNVGRTRGDVTGDGYADLGAGVLTGAGAARVYFGSGGAFNTTADLIVTPPVAGGGAFGWRVRMIGDVNADGYGDFAVAEIISGIGSSAGAVHIYLGDAAGSISDVPALSLVGEVSFDLFGIDLFGGSDIDADGYDDVVVGASNSSVIAGSQGRAYVFFGGDPMNAVADMVFDGAASANQLGLGVGAGGDVNGDGYGDFAIGAIGASAGTGGGVASLYFGGPRPVDTAADLVITGAASGDATGYALALCDLNDDGSADFVVSSTGADDGGANTGRVDVYFGGPSTDATPEGTLVGTVSPNQMGLSVACSGDVDGDGFNDLLVGAPSSGAMDPVSEALLYRGGAGATFDATVDLTLSSGLQGDAFGASLALSDLDGDGFAEMLVGAPNDDEGASNGGKVYVYDGAMSPDATVDASIVGSASGASLGRGLASLSAPSAGSMHPVGVLDYDRGACFAVTDVLSSRTDDLSSCVEGCVPS